MSIRVGINGFGRIGRLAFRAMTARDDIEVVAINDLTPIDSLAHLLKYDSVFGRFPGTVEVGDNALVVNGTSIQIVSERDPANLPWGELNVDFALESTGIFTKREGYGKHLDAGANRVVLSAPAKDAIDATIVMGVNQDTLTADHKVISNASCTTNCLGPMTKVLHDNFGVDHGLMTTVHAYTNDQRVGDVGHSDLRRARAAAVNIIPTSTGAARAIGLVIPELNGKLDGMAFRVPVPDGSVVDLVARVNKDVTAEQVNDALRSAAGGTLKGIMEYTEDPIVSSDIVGNPHSCIIDGLSTIVLEKNLVKVVGWYDNEWGYSNRVADLIAFANNVR
jgi:glyceraldehyde 3-phosphate dehydrogenase